MLIVRAKPTKVQGNVCWRPCISFHASFHKTTWWSPCALRLLSFVFLLSFPFPLSLHLDFACKPGLTATSPSTIINRITHARHAVAPSRKHVPFNWSSAPCFPFLNRANSACKCTDSICRRFHRALPYCRTAIRCITRARHAERCQLGAGASCKWSLECVFPLFFTSLPLLSGYGSIRAGGVIHSDANNNDRSFQA